MPAVTSLMRASSAARRSGVSNEWPSVSRVHSMAASGRADAVAQIGDREHHAIAEAVERHRDVAAGDQQAGLHHVLDRNAVAAQMLLEREALRRGKACLLYTSPSPRDG